MEKPRVTEIQVRMDCNGCVQKIKKALNGINGICDLYIDFPQQKITIIGWADPENIVKAIKKTRKTAIICSHTEPPDPQAQPPDSAAQGDGPGQESGTNNPPPPESANPGPTEGSPAEGAQPAEPPKDPPPPENLKPETKPSQDAAEASAGKTTQPPAPKDVEEVHVIYHHPPDYGYRYGYNPSSMNQGYSGQWQSYPTSPGFRPEPPQPLYVTHSYNTYRASPYVTRYEYIKPPAPVTPTATPQYTNYNSPPPAPAPATPTPQYTNYNSPPPPEYTNYSRPPPPEYTHYSRPPPPEYTQYSRPPPPDYTHYSRPPPPPQYTHYSYSRPESYSGDYHYGNNGNGNITSVFSDENPNACTIV